jgi:hypothetical protein
MANYISDRAFTDHIHNNVAIPVIYNPINWTQVNLDPDDAVHIDMFQGIDYVFNHNGTTKTVQERFRERKYQQYSDFTIRYRRDGNMHSDRHQSEYYKMKADYFTYGITNCLKDDLSQCSDFLKYAIIDLRIVYSKIDAGDILIRDNGRNTCRIIDNKIECPVKFNTDGSSSFFPIEISFLIDLWGNDIIIAQKGFI